MSVKGEQVETDTVKLLTGNFVQGEQVEEYREERRGCHTPQRGPNFLVVTLFIV
jgi:hypothetical protein